MKTLTATDLKTNTSEFFDCLISDGEITVTRNGKAFMLKLVQKASDPQETDSSKLVDAMFALAKSIPEESKEEVGQAMLERLKRQRDDAASNRVIPESWEPSDEQRARNGKNNRRLLALAKNGEEGEFLDLDRSYQEGE